MDPVTQEPVVAHQPETREHVALVRTLAPLAPGLRLKWPNDLQRDARKLGGILV